MIAESLDSQELDEMWCEDDPSMRHRSSWPAWKDEGSDTSACYFEIPPGCSLGPHVHDSEEHVVLLGAAVAPHVREPRRRAAPHRAVERSLG